MSHGADERTNITFVARGFMNNKDTIPASWIQLFEDVEVLEKMSPEIIYRMEKGDIDFLSALKLVMVEFFPDTK